MKIRVTTYIEGLNALHDHRGDASVASVAKSLASALVDDLDNSLRRIVL